MTPRHAPAGSFTERLNLLFKASAVENPDRPRTYTEYTPAQVAHEINKKFGAGSITDEYIRKLRRGDIKSPSVLMASYLAWFFKMPLDVFAAVTDDEASEPSEIANKVWAELQRIATVKSPQHEDPEPNETIRGLARSAGRLSQEGLQRAARYVQQLEQLEQMEDQLQTDVPPENH
ncbi:hypothetical protein [Streptomyces sp. NBC_00268]|uniref:hypothetical protein n=1 Tax=Streptomyces sp. NBC_00268 TaxID=2975695 RepID=UPI00225525E4|nr:hypothetical protein [Streptomyces sp. NBC_00268]MCX5182567.1 hypothetical protein [Streptomyces sp. NBC_00268]